MRDSKFHLNNFYFEKELNHFFNFLLPRLEWKKKKRISVHKTQIDRVKAFIPALFKIIWWHFHRRNMLISKIPKFSTPLPFIVKEIFQIYNHAKREKTFSSSKSTDSFTYTFVHFTEEDVFLHKWWAHVTLFIQ